MFGLGIGLSLHSINLTVTSTKQQTGRLTTGVTVGSRRRDQIFAEATQRRGQFVGTAGVAAP